MQFGRPCGRPYMSDARIAVRCVRLACDGEFADFFVEEVKAAAVDADDVDFVENAFEQVFFFMLFADIPLQELEGGEVLLGKRSGYERVD